MRLSRISYYLLPMLYLAIGGSVTAMLVQRVLYHVTSVWLVLLLPMVMVTVLLTVVGIVNVWLSYRTWRDPGLLRQYSQRSLLWLYMRCWAVVMSGLTLAVVFAWLHQLLPDYMQQLFSDLSLLFYVICGVLTLAALMSIVLGENLQEVRLRNAQTENHLLKSQLNPHFLYNTLNNIDALIWLDQERASSAVTGLSGLMRYMTYSARQEQVPLVDEVNAIRQLCQLQALRLSCPDAVRFDAPDDCRDWKVAPLLLIPLVENCFKHCGDVDQPDAICIRLELDEQRLRFVTDNTLPTPEAATDARPSHRKGIGLDVLRRRLELLYPAHYAFMAEGDGQRFRTSLTISC